MLQHPPAQPGGIAGAWPAPAPAGEGDQNMVVLRPDGSLRNQTLHQRGVRHQQEHGPSDDAAGRTPHGHDQTCRLPDLPTLFRHLLAGPGFSDT